MEAESRYISNTIVIEYIIVLKYSHLVSVLKEPNPPIKTNHPIAANPVKTIEEIEACEQGKSHTMYNIHLDILYAVEMYTIILNHCTVLP